MIGPEVYIYTALSVFIVAFIFGAELCSTNGIMFPYQRARKYKSGTGWCFWRWTDVDSEYIVRLHLVKTPWFAICLHWIRKPDAEPWLHDHPVSFLSIILRGWYSEIRKVGGWCGCDIQPEVRTHLWANFIRASEWDRHTIMLCNPDTLTICFMGPKTREWGFHHTDGRWLGWKEYYARKRAGKDPWRGQS